MDKAIEITTDIWKPVQPDRFNEDAAGVCVAVTAHVATDPTWPASLHPEGFYGIAGELVEMIDPHTEADPAALLIQLLIGFGNVIGRSAPYQRLVRTDII